MSFPPPHPADDRKPIAPLATLVGVAWAAAGVVAFANRDGEVTLLAILVGLAVTSVTGLVAAARVVD